MMVVVVIGGSNYNYNYDRFLIKSVKLNTEIGFIIYYMYLYIYYIYIYICSKKSNTTLGPKFYCQLAPFTKLTFWGRTAKSSRLSTPKFQGLSDEIGPRAVGATLKIQKFWLCIPVMSGKCTFLKNK